MRRPRLGGWVVGVWLVLQASQTLSATLLFLADRETSLFQAWSRDSHESSITPVTLAPPGDGIPLRGFLAADRPKSSRAIGSPDSLADLCRRQPIQVVVVLGDEAARAAVQACPLPTLVVGMPRRQVAPLLAERRPEPVSAIYLETDPSLDLRLARALLPTARTVGVLVPAPAPAWLAPLRAEARRLELALEEIVATDDLSAVRALRPRLAGLDAVLLPPEPSLVNEWSLKPLLLMTVRQGVPVLGGASARYVDAGVLAAAVADEERLPAQMRPLIADLARGRAPAPVYPAAVRVAVNPTVAHTLGVPAEAVERARSLFARP
jgi:ABC-type uncharacterized transport system substrate-binding protein